MRSDLAQEKAPVSARRCSGGWSTNAARGSAWTKHFDDVTYCALGSFERRCSYCCWSRSYWPNFWEDYSHNEGSCCRSDSHSRALTIEARGRLVRCHSKNNCCYRCYEKKKQNQPSPSPLLLPHLLHLKHDRLVLLTSLQGLARPEGCMPANEATLLSAASNAGPA